ncbi:ester cyclase [Serratia quinivorans]|uniref:ester cyclase n=1 Tax=Serratia quinivorans TaxID=137545 RepID=UPI0034C60803
MNNYTTAEKNNMDVVKALYTDVFDSGNCPVVNSYYHDDAVCHLKGNVLKIEEMKQGMAEFVAKHENIVTTIESLVARDDRTYARLRRDVTLPGEGVRSIEIMVEKRFEGSKVKELWFMVDDEIYSNIWLSKSGG